MKKFRVKIIVSVYLCLIVLALYNSFHSYQNNLSSGKAEVFAKLSSLSNIVGMQINGDQHQKITAKYGLKDGIKSTDQDKDYKEIQAQLASIQNVSKLSSDIYTLIPTKDFKKFYFGVTSNPTPYFRHLYHTPPPELIKNYKKGSILDEYTDENGIWLSAFTPIKNSKNEVVAVVQLDKDFSDFKAGIMQKLITNVFLILICYSVIGAILYFFLKDALVKEERYVSSQKEYNLILEKEVSMRTHELSLSNAKLHKLNKELESFFYSTSHDIRGPLCRILGLSSLAKIETDKQMLVEMIELESQKMDDMLKKMILVNNIRTKDLKIKNINVAKDTAVILAGLREKYLFKKEKITIDIKSERSNSFNCDAELFESIVVNLLDNAFKFCDHNNPIIKINSFIDENGIFSFSVKNNGKVFSEIEKENAFELFKRANKMGDMDTLRLGLYAIKTSLDRLNGLIDIYTEDGFTEIRVMVPDNLMTEKINTELQKQSTPFV